jgi:hypothetical protein
MKRIPYIEDIHAEGVTGLPLYFLRPGDYNTVTTTVTEYPVMLSQLEFYLERSNDPRLIEGMEPYEGNRLRYFLRKSLREQGPTAKARGGYDLDDSPYERFRTSIMKPEQKLILETIRFNYFRCEEAVCDAVKVEEKTASNGVTAQAS